MTVTVSETRRCVPTEETYTGFQKAYEFLNRKLFDGELPNCLITPNRFNGRGPLLFTLPLCGIAAPAGMPSSFLQFWSLKAAIRQAFP
jgi:hypothetical protein